MREMTQMTQLISETTLSHRLGASSSQIAQFCQRWHVSELAVFGSVLREDFRPDHSDVDVLVSFAPNHSWTYDAAFQMREELMALFHRRVDLISRSSLEQSPNWLRRKQILDSAQVLYRGA